MVNVQSSELPARVQWNSATAGLFDPLNEYLRAPTDGLRPAQRVVPTKNRLITKASSKEEQLYDALAQFKVYTSQVAMHFKGDWRQRFFKQLDNLLDAENWEDADTVPNMASFVTLLRLLLAIEPEKRPGLGATATGTIVATWRDGDSRLLVECQSADKIRWSLSLPGIDGLERAAGVSNLLRLCAILAPYEPQRWFGNGSPKNP